MRRRFNLSMLVACLAVLMAVTVFMPHGSLGRWVADSSGRLLAPVVQRIGYGRALIIVLTGRNDLIRENIELKSKIEQTQAAMARADELDRENQFLRAAVGLQEKTSTLAIQADVFGYLRAGGVREMVLNVGHESGVILGDIVITATGMLVGIVQNTAENHSLVRIIGDPALEITARIIGTDVTGLVRVDLHSGLILDLVQKSETSLEGQIIATSGNDRLPPGIIVGRIRSVDTESTTLFKVIHISPVIESDFSGKVLVFHP